MQKLKNLKTIIIVCLSITLLEGLLNHRGVVTNNLRVISDTINQYATDISKYADPALRPLTVSKYNDSGNVEAVVENTIIDAMNLSVIDIRDIRSGERAELIIKTMDELIAIDLKETRTAIAPSEYEIPPQPINEKFNRMGAEVKNKLLKANNSIDGAWRETILRALCTFIMTLIMVIAITVSRDDE